MKSLAEQLREAFIFTRKTIHELEVGMTVQVRIRGVVQKMGSITFVDPDEQFVTVEDWAMRGKFTNYDKRYVFYQVPPPREAVFDGEEKTEDWAMVDMGYLQDGGYVHVRSKTSGKLVATGTVKSVDHELGCVSVFLNGSPQEGDGEQEYCKGGYSFFVWTEIGQAVKSIGVARGY